MEVQLSRPGAEGKELVKLRAVLWSLGLSTRYSLGAARWVAAPFSEWVPKEARLGVVLGYIAFLFLTTLIAPV